MDQLNVGVDVNRAAEVLRNGGLVAIPTETVYGLAANALDEEAVHRIFKVKNRPLYDPLIVHTSSLQKVEHLLEDVPQLARELADEYWPGPLSIILKKKPGGLSDLITAGHPTVAIRVPRHPLTMQLLMALDFPLVAPSANPFGYVSPTAAKHVINQLGDQVDYVLDGGRTDVGLESTIIDLTIKPPLLRRKGGIPMEKLKGRIPKLQMATHSTSNPQAPGMLESHYATSTPLRLIDLETALKDHSIERIGGLFFKQPHPYIHPENQRVLSESGDLHEAAHQLFYYMRELDALDLDLILTEWVPDVGLGKAINDKLQRAAVI